MLRKSIEIRQIEPAERPVSLEGLYLSHGLQELAKRIGRPIVVANYITDLIAVKGQRGSPEQLQNPSDWRLFQEVTAQADVIITGTSYMSEFVEKGDVTQDVLTQFDKGNSFEDLGDWREQHGLRRSPDLVVVSRSLDFRIPKLLFNGGRRIVVFAPYSMQESERAKELEKAGAAVIGAGKEGVDGAVMIGRLAQDGYAVIKLTTGPRVLNLLINAKFVDRKGEVIQEGAVDRLYITRVDRKVTDDPSMAVTVLDGMKVDDLTSEGGGFKRMERYAQEEVITNDGFETSQEFLVYVSHDMAHNDISRRAI